MWTFRNTHVGSECAEESGINNKWPKIERKYRATLRCRPS